MLQRILAVLLVVGVLASLILYSQLRSPNQAVSGFIEADEIRLGSRVGGRVLHVRVQEGDHVQPGAVLVELEPFDLLNQERQASESLAAREAEWSRVKSGYREEEIAQAKARYDQLKARLDLLIAGPRGEEKEAAVGRLQVAEAELKLARQNHSRISGLISSGVSSREEMDQATQRLDAAQAILLVRRKELDLLEKGTREEEIREAQARVEEAQQGWLMTKNGFRPEDIEQARAARNAAEAELNAIRERIAELTIKSPVVGTVEALELQPGDLVAAGAPVMSILDPSRLWVRAYVPENRLGVRTGETAWITVDSFPRQRFKAEITYVARQAEFTPSNIQTPAERIKQVFRIKVTLIEGLDRLRPGMSADVWLADQG